MVPTTTKGAVLAQDPQDQVFSPKEIYLPQRDKGQGMKDKDRRQKISEKGKETKERGKRYLSGGGQRTVSG